MEFTGRFIDASYNLESKKYRIVFEVNEQHAVTQGLDNIKGEEKLSIKAVKYSKKRSLDANAYLWLLLRKMSEKVGAGTEEIYRSYIRDYGVCEIIPIRDDAIDKWCSVWNEKGYGWVTEDIGACKNIKGYHNIKCFYGSSTYSSSEMNRMLSAVVQDCKALGIEVLSPDELERMKSAWQNG